MEGNYPVILDGREQGTIEVRQEGLLTVFRARCADPGTLVRLSLYGEREGYLGVMVPGPEGLELTRRLSRAALADFPRQPRYAAPAGQSLPNEIDIISEQPEETTIVEVDINKDQKDETPELEVDIKEEQKEETESIKQIDQCIEEVSIIHDISNELSEGFSENQETVDINIEVETALPLESGAEEIDITNDTVWYAGPGGCLYSAGEGERWLAVPATAEGDPTGGRGLYREIQGRSYLIFRIGTQTAAD